MEDVVFARSVCPECSAVNYVRLGTLQNEARLHFDGVRCRACRREYLTDPEPAFNPRFEDGTADI